MLEKINVYIYNPSIKTGGTNNLLGNLAVLLSDLSIYSVNYIDYFDSPVATIIRKQTTEVNYIEYKPKIKLENGILISTLLDVKNIKKDFSLSEKVRLLFWSTHPDDGLKILPSFNIWLRKKEFTSKLYAKLIHPVFKEKIKKFIHTGMINNGVIWMDPVNFNSNKFFYNLSAEPTYCPIFSSNSKTSSIPTYKDNLKIVILGRFADFKTFPLFGLLDQIGEYIRKTDSHITINFIGDGPYRKLIENWIIEKKIEDVNFLGHVDLSQLDSYLLDNHLLIGMGTSVLEGAKLKLPSLLMDGSYEVIDKEHFRMQWIFEIEPYHVGKLVTNLETKLEGKTFAEIMTEIRKTTDLSYFGNKSYLHWKAYHSPEAVLKIVMNIIQNNTFYFSKQNQKLIKRDLVGYLIDMLKKVLK